jgi:hypothetical protein
MPPNARPRHSKRIEVVRTNAAEKFRRLAIKKELVGRDDKPAGKGSTLSFSQKRGRCEYKDFRLVFIAMYVYCL